MDNGSTLGLGFTTVATENADTLLDITVQLLRELTDVYCTDDADKEETFKALLSKMTFLMSDRAAVMKSYNSKVKDFIESERVMKFLFTFSIAMPTFCWVKAIPVRLL